MKYLINDHGIEWFKRELKKYFKYNLEELKAEGKASIDDYLGWHRQDKKRWFIKDFIDFFPLTNLVLLFDLIVFTLITLTLNIFSTLLLIVFLLAPECTLKTTLLNSERAVAFSVIAGEIIVSN